MAKIKFNDELIADTRESAIAFVEDYWHLKGILETQNTSPVDLRISSSILRRWLVEGLLARVARPRLKPLEIRAIDNNPVYRLARTGRIHSFVSAGTLIHGIYIAAGMTTLHGEPVELEGYHPENLIDVDLDTFQKQKVIFTKGEWITRHQVIKFVANVGHGVHGGSAKESYEKLLADFRNQVAVSIVVENGAEITNISWSLGGVVAGKSLTIYDPNSVSGVLLELLATISFLTSSPKIIELVDLIKREI